MTTPPDPATETEKFIKMTRAPLEKLVISLAIPSIFIMIITALYNMADTFFVGKLGTSAVAGVGIAFPFMAVIQALGFFFGQGSGNYMARALGAKRTEDAYRMSATGLVSGFSVMAAIALAGLVFLGPLVIALGATKTIQPYAMDYLFFILLASPWMVAATVLNQQLRFQGSSAIAMVGMLTGGILNIFLDPLFITTFRLGIKGASIATMISQMLSFVILFCYGNMKKGNIPVKLRYFSPSVSRFAEMIKGGIPALLRQGLMSIATIIINHFAKPYGDAAIAAISIVQRLGMFAVSLVMGFGQGFQPVCGFNYGAKLYSRVRKSFWFCIRICFTGLVIIAACMAIFAPHIIALFRKDDLEVIEIGTRGLRLNCITLPLVSVFLLSNMMVQTMGKTLEASIVAASRQGLFLIPCLFILPPFLGLLGIQLAGPVSDLGSFIVSALVLTRVFRQISAPDGPGA